jgi:hypothetical protein
MAETYPYCSNAFLCVTCATRLSALPDDLVRDSSAVNLPMVQESAILLQRGSCSGGIAATAIFLF